MIIDQKGNAGENHEQDVSRNRRHKHKAEQRYNKQDEIHPEQLGTGKGIVGEIHFGAAGIAGKACSQRGQFRRIFTRIIMPIS